MCIVSSRVCKVNFGNAKLLNFEVSQWHLMGQTPLLRYRHSICSCRCGDMHAGEGAIFNGNVCVVRHISPVSTLIRMVIHSCLSCHPTSGEMYIFSIIIDIFRDIRSGNWWVTWYHKSFNSLSFEKDADRFYVIAGKFKILTSDIYNYGNGRSERKITMETVFETDTDNQNQRYTLRDNRLSFTNIQNVWILFTRIYYWIYIHSLVNNLLCTYGGFWCHMFDCWTNKVLTINWWCVYSPSK